MSTHSSDRIPNLFGLPGLRRIALRSNRLQLLLVRLDPLLQRRDVILGVSVPTIEHIPHADQRITHRLKILKYALVPGSRFVFEERLRSADVLGSALDSFVE